MWLQISRSWSGLQVQIIVLNASSLTSLIFYCLYTPHFPLRCLWVKRLGVLSTVRLPVASYGCTWVDHQQSTCTIRCLFFLQTWVDEWYPVSSSRTHRCEALSETASELIHDAPRLRACCCAIGWIGSFQNWKGSVLICNPIQGKEEVRNKPSVLSPIVFITRAGPGLI